MVNYREAYGTHAANGMTRRGPTFVTFRVTRAFARIHLGIQQTLVLGNFGATLDWGDARDCHHVDVDDVQQPQADDFVIATGKGLLVRASMATIVIREIETRHTRAASFVRVCPCCCTHGEIRN